MSTKKVHFIGKVLHELPSCPSTNNYVIEFQKDQKIDEGTVFFTSNQTQGRGQAGSQWISEPYKNLAFTTIIYPHYLKPSEQIYLNQAVALASREVIALFTQQNTYVKWPNDIYLDNRKVAGILIQNTVSTNQLNTSVIGIGINVNQSSFPPDLPLASSMAIETNKTFSIHSVLLQLCQSLNKMLDILAQKAFQKIHQEYLNHLYRMATSTLFEDNEGQIFEGKITGINQAGQLLIETSLGQRAFNIKEVKITSIE